MLPCFLTPPSFPKNMTDTKTPEDAKKWNKGTKGKMLGKKRKNEEADGKYNTEEEK